MAGVDLKFCYDRVAHSPAYLAMRSYGIPSETIESIFQTIQNMQYFTFSSHGISKKVLQIKKKDILQHQMDLGKETEQARLSGPL